MHKTVVVTGGFQLLHKGHINLLTEANKLGDVWVLLNDDEALLRTKGYLAEPGHIRIQKLIATRLVKKITIIGDDPTELLSQIKPDYQVCGSDHTIEEVMQKGGQFVGKIVILPYTEGICSRDLYKESKK